MNAAKYSAEEYAAAYREHGSFKKAARALGASAEAVRRGVKRAGMAMGAEGQARGPARTGDVGDGKIGGRVRVADIMMSVDPLERVMRVLATVPAGELMTRDEMAVAMGMGERRARLILNAPALAERRVMLKDVAPYPDGMYFGGKADVARVQEQLKKARLYQ